MIIQSKRVWVLGQFLEAQLEIENGTIVNVLAYGAKPVTVISVSFRALSISIPTVLTAGIPTTRQRTAYAIG